MTAGAPTRSDESGSARWLRAARADDLRGDGPLTASAGGVDLVLVRGRTAVRAYEGRCPHQGALLGEGELDGQTLVCRNHRWRFDRDTGQRSGGPQCLRACPVREENGDLLVDVSALTRDLDVERRTVPPVALRAVDDLPGPPGLPVLGNVLEMNVGRLHQIYEEWEARYGSPFVVRFGRSPILVLSDPGIIERVLRARPDTYRRLSTLEAVFDEMHVSGVFSVEGEAWRPQRRLAMAALSHQHLRGFYPTLHTVAERLARRWRRAAESGRVLDVIDELKRFTVDVTMGLVFGYDLNTLETEDDDDVVQRDLEHLFPAFARRLNSLVPYWRYVRLPQDRRLDRALAALRAWLDGLIGQSRGKLAADPRRAKNPANFIEAMLAARDEEGRPFSNEVLFGNALTMLLAGEDTTANTLAWAVHHLTDSPASRAALRAEIDATLGSAEVPATIEQADRLAYATAVANETMRLRPVAPLFFMEPNEDVILGDVRVPKGHGMLLLLRPPALDPKSFEAPCVFRPERWIERGASAHEPSASLPFGSGPRICPGRSLALLEMRVVLATLYRSFDVERVGLTNDVHERFAFAMTPVGLRVRLRMRP